MAGPSLRWRTILCALLALSLVTPGMLAAEERRVERGPKRQRDAVHLLEPFRGGDTNLADTLEGAVSSLKAGHEVMVLFDLRSVTSLRVRKDGQTPLESTELSVDERRTIASQLGVPSSEAPRNYLEYLQRLAKAGAKVFVNRTSARLYGLQDDEIHPLAKLISARQMADLLDETDLCYTYGR